MITSLISEMTDYLSLNLSNFPSLKTITSPVLLVHLAKRNLKFKQYEYAKYARLICFLTQLFHGNSFVK